MKKSVTYTYFLSAPELFESLESGTTTVSAVVYDLVVLPLSVLVLVSDDGVLSLYEVVMVFVLGGERNESLLLFDSEVDMFKRISTVLGL